MKLKILIIIVLFLFSNKIISQGIEIVNPAGNSYLGVEIGPNKISSFSRGEDEYSFQGGVLAEHYFARHWSFSGRIKYFETGVSFYVPKTTGWFSNDEYSGTFKGAVIAIPFDIKWEFRIYKNLGASLKLGYAFTVETQSNYSNYSSNLSTDYVKQYGSVNYGAGLNYFINKKMAAYIDLEYFTGKPKGYSNAGFFGNTYHYTENKLINFGIKFDFEEM